jgi:hypothetical protein
MKGSESAPKPAGNSVFQHNQPFLASATGNKAEPPQVSGGVVMQTCL